MRSRPGCADGRAGIGPDPRVARLAANLNAVRERIAAAALAAGRRPGEVTLIAVTKTFPVDDVRRLAALGVGDFGENRDQEASVKASLVPAVRWHFVGRLQRNKARGVAGYVDVVHSVDRPELVDALDTASARVRSRPLDVLAQIDLDPQPDPRRGGIRPAEVAGLTDRIAAATHLRLAGVMAVAPLGGDPDQAFGRLAVVSARIRADRPDAAMVSAGMSGDLEAAIRHGATHVRVGTALLGGRENLVR
ncbi:MAG TPA: YggS family pyridoxal phosphate-dependent enzyme [Mycobacteriales bacterium]|nr:YggS family pyridoxal phosphate-dependent enzyme [Mycobacteriales bacterium]